MSFDAVEKNAAFAKKYEFPFRLLADPVRAAGVAYGAAADASQHSASRAACVIGPDGKVIAYFPKVKAADFPGEALAILGG